MAGFGIDDRIECGHEHHLLVLRLQHVVQGGQHPARRFADQRCGLEQGPRDQHEECSGNALARYVRYDQADAALVDGEVIVEIAAHLLGRDHPGRDLDRPLGRRFARQHRELQVVGDGQLPFDRDEALLVLERLAEFFDEFRQPAVLFADTLRHLLEHEREGLEFVACALPLKSGELVGNRLPGFRTDRRG